jgi:hypothetical protein
VQRQIPSSPRGKRDAKCHAPSKALNFKTNVDRWSDEKPKIWRKFPIGDVFSFCDEMVQCKQEVRKRISSSPDRNGNESNGKTTVCGEELALTETG